MIDPALDADEWQTWRECKDDAMRAPDRVEGYVWDGAWSGVIAMANDALRDDDQRKLRRAWIDDLRIAQNEAQDAAWRSCMNGEPGKPCDECQRAVDGFKARLQTISDALASYLLPEP